ncbi:MAG: ferredoxin [Planctomycetota bacterium]|nr:ferredoxin [Planctomycetota bacterium]
MRATVNPDTCTGCGLCVETCPSVFEIKDDLAVVIADPIPGADEDAARQAADDCPVEAIAIEEE